MSKSDTTTRIDELRDSPISLVTVSASVYAPALA